MDVIQAWVTLVKDIVTGLAAVVATILAIRGFNTWKEQLTTQSEHSLARRALIAVYKYRDALVRVYSSFSIVKYKGVDRFPELLIQLQDKSFTRLDEVEANLEVELLEAEAVWGDEEPLFKSLVTALTAQKYRLHTLRDQYRHLEQSSSLTLTILIISTTILEK